jgi:hypothetical protein
MPRLAGPSLDEPADKIAMMATSGINSTSTMTHDLLVRPQVARIHRSNWITAVIAGADVDSDAIVRVDWFGRRVGTGGQPLQSSISGCQCPRRRLTAQACQVVPTRYRWSTTMCFSRSRTWSMALATMSPVGST